MCQRLEDLVDQRTLELRRARELLVTEEVADGAAEALARAAGASAGLAPALAEASTVAGVGESATDKLNRALAKSEARAFASRSHAASAQVLVAECQWAVSGLLAQTARLRKVRDVGGNSLATSAAAQPRTETTGAGYERFAEADRVIIVLSAALPELAFGLFGNTPTVTR